MRGKNPKRPVKNSDGYILDVQEIFTTIQGEGPYSGAPAVFVRLGGCNLACDFCDTEFEDYKPASIDKIMDEITGLVGDATGERRMNLVVITGGEPFRQNIEALCDRLVDRDFKVQIETNGTIYRKINSCVDIVCSPKNTGKGYRKIRDDLLGSITAFKFIISKTHYLYNDIADVGQGRYDIPVYVQPMDEYDEEKNAANVLYAREIAMKNNYILSVQLQKILGIR